MQILVPTHSFGLLIFLKDYVVRALVEHTTPHQLLDRPQGFAGSSGPVKNAPLFTID